MYNIKKNGIFMGTSYSWKNKINNNISLTRSDIEFLKSISPDIDKTKEEYNKLSCLSFNELSSIYINNFKGKDIVGKDELCRLIAIDFIMSKIYPSKEKIYAEMLKEEIDFFEKISLYANKEDASTDE